MHSDRAVETRSGELFYEVFKLCTTCCEVSACHDVIGHLLPLIFGRIPHDWNKKNKAIAENGPDFKCDSRRARVGWIDTQFVIDGYYSGRLAAP
ncbi:hypothetical protein RE9427_48470 (plasmid) [Prescottella equi]|nr:hypothetical protein RE9427_48470 [Prescottella equi]